MDNSSNQGLHRSKVLNRQYAKPEGSDNPVVERLNVREQKVRESLINLEEIKLLQTEVKECYYREGVNHYEKCKDVVLAYKKALEADKVHGTLS
jgi:hypothetical protein